MRKNERVARLEKKATVSRIDTLCICQFYSDYKGCTCKEAYAKIKAEGRTPTIEDFYKIHTNVV